MRRILPALLALCLSPALPAQAQTAPATAPSPEQNASGAVAQFMAAQNLFAIGRLQNDPLAVLAAARLAARIRLDDTDRAPEPLAEALPPSHPDAATMFTAAKALAAEDAATVDLIAQSEAEATRLAPRTLLRTTRGIPAAQSQTYTLAFFAGSLAEIGLLGDGKTNLDLAVSLGEQALCLDTAPTDRALCAFSLPENASVTVTITNRSETAASYSLLTN